MPGTRQLDKRGIIMKSGENLTLSSTEEWILTNRLGGYALGTSHLINMRKYHGLLIASNEQLRRIHLVSSVEEKIGVKEDYAFMDTNRYQDVIYPDGYRNIAEVCLRPYPAFLYNFKLAGRDVHVVKEVLMYEGKNITLMSYSNINEFPLNYQFRYKFSLRDHHHVNSPGTFDHLPLEYDTIKFNKFTVGWVKRDDVDAEVYVYTLKGDFRLEPIIFRNVFYSGEDERGYDAKEDLFSPFDHVGTLNPGQMMTVLFSDKILEGEVEEELIEIRSTVRERYSNFFLPEKHPSRFICTEDMKKIISMSDEEIFTKEEYVKITVLLLSDFQTKSDIIAGFPWFSAWGRDTMISLAAYIKQGKNWDFVFNVLNTYGKRIENGLLPNVVGEDGKGANFDTVDASLWFLLRVYEVFEIANTSMRKELFHYCSNVVLNYLFNEHLPFYCDRTDNLISIRHDIKSALTWMDAKIEGNPVTPRYGKPIEINALWLNGINFLIHMAEKLALKKIIYSPYEISLEELKKSALKILKSMEKFYKHGVWCDRIDNKVPITEIRPNFVIALSLPFDFTDIKGLKQGEELARKHLVTPFGLRSLSPQSPMYKGCYIGNQQKRDRSYHQGTVWTWLLLPYAQLLEKVIQEKGLLKSELEKSIYALRKGIRKGSLASIAEIWDGENPNVPKGAPAQAWSVAAVFYIEKMIEEL